MKKLRVSALAGGRIVPYRREGALPSIDEGWWQSVLQDRRAARGAMPSRIAEDSSIAFYRLDRLPGPTFRVECICGLSGDFDKDELIRSIGGDAHIHWLATKMLDCGKKNKIGNYCRARCRR